MPDDVSETELGHAERLIMFSDAVVAIAITLLALELPVPEGVSFHDLVASARHNDGHYLAFLISFAVIAASWNEHHDVFRYVRRCDSGLRTLNLLWLLTIVLNPFATKLLTAQTHDSLGSHALRFGFYSLLQVVATGAFLAMVHRLAAHHLQAPDTPPALLVKTNWHAYGVMLGFGLSIPVFFASAYGWVLWIVMPLLTRWTHRFLLRQRQ